MKGVYELVYFVKESKALDRFRKTSEQYDRLVEGKTDEEIEKLVSSSFRLTGINLSYYSFGRL